MMIVKIQKPLASNSKEPLCLVYNQQRTFEILVKYSGELKEQFGDKLKIFASIKKLPEGGMHVKKYLPDQDW